MTLPLLGAGRTAPGPAPTEDIRPNSTGFAYETITGAATAHAALADDSEASYVNGDASFAQWTGGATDLTSAAGRGVVSFVVIVRCRSLAATNGYVAAAMTGATVTPDTPAMSPPTTPGDVTVGPFTRSGGGNFTEAQMNSLALDVGVEDTDGNPRIYEVTVRVTYA